MDSTSVDLVGSKISDVSVEGDIIKVRFEPAYLVKTMTGSVERTRWWQNGNLVFKGAELVEDQPLPNLPAECAGGDVGENIYTYRDMVPVPLASQGHVHCRLKVDGQDAIIAIDGESIALEMEAVAKYIEHLRPE